MLDEFVRQGVASWRDSGLRNWATWLRKDLVSQPYAWLRPDFVTQIPFLVNKDKEAKTPRILVEPHLIDAEFCKAWMPHFCRSGHPAVMVSQVLNLVEPFLPQEPVVDLPKITGQDLFEVAKANKSTTGLDGGAWNEIKALPPAWFSGLAALLSMVGSTGVWPQDLLDAYISLIANTDGDYISMV